MERFSNKMAIAPTASISIIAGNASPGIEPIAANVFLQKTLSGSFTVRNRHLQQLLEARGLDTDEVWSSITLRAGSVQHLDFLTEQEKAVYKTAFELDQRWIIEHAADRTPYICQSQSVNVFLPANVHKRDLHEIHMLAWKRGREVAVLLPVVVDPTRGHGERHAGIFVDRHRAGGERSYRVANGGGCHELRGVS